jgi:outer membrane lipoprotein-sorting protein
MMKRILKIIAVLMLLGACGQSQENAAKIKRLEQAITLIAQQGTNQRAVAQLLQAKD